MNGLTKAEIERLIRILRGEGASAGSKPIDWRIGRKLEKERGVGR